MFTYKHIEFTNQPPKEGPYQGDINVPFPTLSLGISTLTRHTLHYLIKWTPSHKKAANLVASR